MNSKKTRFGQVVKFNREVLGITARINSLQKPEEAALSYTQLVEEANEFRDAVEEVDYIGCIDAIIDSLYFSYGILYKLGLDEALVNRLFTVVHNANMQKAKGIKAGREGFNAADASKPEDWIDPRTAMMEILCDYIKI